MRTEDKILEKLPYSHPFLFVDELVEITDSTIKGIRKFNAGEYFYQGHFAGNPVTPGVILLECMGQIGLVCFGYYLLGLHKKDLKVTPALSHLEADFVKPVFPGETMTVFAEKIYFRKNILKCKISITDENGEPVAYSVASCKFSEEKD